MGRNKLTAVVPDSTWAVEGSPGGPVGLRRRGLLMTAGSGGVS